LLLVAFRAQTAMLNLPRRARVGRALDALSAESTIALLCLAPPPRMWGDVTSGMPKRGVVLQSPQWPPSIFVQTLSFLHRDVAMIQNHSTHLWLARFAERLVEHFPNMNPLSAVKRAIAMFPEMSHLDAISAADAFAADPEGARSLVMRGQVAGVESHEPHQPHEQDAAVHVNFMRQLPAAGAARSAHS
jgi:hypothetical protein